MPNPFAILMLIGIDIIAFAIGGTICWNVISLAICDNIGYAIFMPLLIASIVVLFGGVFFAYGLIGYTIIKLRQL